MCIEIPEPFGQFELTALCIMCSMLLINKKTIMTVGCALILYTGVQLQIQFNELVHYSDAYITIDANTYKPMAKGCSEMKGTEGITAESLWHTWFTGIYKIKK